MTTFDSPMIVYTWKTHHSAYPHMKGSLIHVVVKLEWRSYLVDAWWMGLNGDGRELEQAIVMCQA